MEKCTTCDGTKIVTVPNGEDDFDEKPCPDCGLESDKEESNDR